MNVSNEYIELNVDVSVLDDLDVSSIDPPSERGDGNYFFGEYSTTAELTCLAPEGIPSALIWWQGPRGELLTDRTVATESVLSFARILPEDAGVYSCWTQNLFRTQSFSINITVTSKLCT